MKNKSQGTVYLAWGLGLLVDALLDQVLGTNALIFSLVVLIGQRLVKMGSLFKYSEMILVFLDFALSV